MGGGLGRFGVSGIIFPLTHPSSRNHFEMQIQTTIPLATVPVAIQVFVASVVVSVGVSGSKIRKSTPFCKCRVRRGQRMKKSRPRDGAANHIVEPRDYSNKNKVLNSAQR